MAAISGTGTMRAYSVARVAEIVADATEPASS